MRRVLLLILLCAAPAFAFEPYLVKDINPDFRSGGSQPSRFTALGDVAFFEATTGDDGVEPWASDGTAAGTFLLADVCSGICSSHPRVLMATPKGYFFSASNRSGERELWVSQGTPASTIRLATRLGTSWEVPPLYLESQGVLYFVGFSAKDSVPVAQLWRSDGNPAGTYALADLHPGAPTFGRIVPFRGRIFFSTNDGSGAGASLWVSDGTAAGTRLLKRAWPENGLAPLQGLIATSRFLYFFAVNPKNGLDLWRSDGTSKGTQRVAGLNLLARPGEPALQGVAAFGDRLLFAGTADAKGDEIWMSDGTAAGTRKITNFLEPIPFGKYGSIHPLIPLGNRLVFAANDGTKGRELWVTDGTAKGTRLLVDVVPGSGSGVSSLGQVYKERLLFTGTDGRRGQELWTTDGTPQGTRMIRDICRGNCSSFPFGALPLNGDLLFIADSLRGREFWKTDGTTAGTVPVTGDIPTDFLFSRIALPGKVLFSRRDEAHGEELWATDGTAAGTGLLADLNDANQAGSFPGDFLRLGNTLLFAAYDGQRTGLWKSDGTAEGTVFVHDLNADPLEPPSVALEILDSAEAGGALFLNVDRGGNSPLALWRTDGTAAGTVLLDLGRTVERAAGSLRALGDKVFFVSWDPDSGRDELWVIDGTAEGPRKLTGLLPETPVANPEELTVYQGKLFFSANGPFPDNAPYSGRELWKTDGTEAGTVLVRDVDWGALNPTLLTVHQGVLYFSGEDDEHGRELWVSDGTSAGTRRVTDAGPEFESFQIGAMTSAGSLLFLWNAGASGQSGLWVSDGTAAGTRKISPVTRTTLFTPPVLLDGIVYFFGWTSGFTTLWRSDGTETGTFQILREEDTGYTSLSPSPFATAGGLLFFKQGDALWRSDGTAAAKVRDRVGSAPFALGPRIFFQAYDPATGTELWAIDTRED